jgi:hypothetical protein
LYCNRLREYYRPSYPYPFNYKVDDSCYQANHGSATAIVGGGNGGYTYDWSNNIPGQTNYNLGAGTYTVTVTDSKGCTITGSTTIAQPASGLSNSITKQDVNCFGISSGSITTNVSGGTPTYTLLLGVLVVFGSAPTGLAAGTYYLTVSDNKACALFDTITLTQPASALTVTTSHTDVKCHGGSDGTVNINISGGTAPYTYLGNPIPAGTTTIPSLAAGTYAGNIVDNKSCFVAVSETVTEPAVQSLSLTSTNNVCFGGATATATANFVNATGVVSYNWNPGGVLPPLVQDSLRVLMRLLLPMLICVLYREQRLSLNLLPLCIRSLLPISIALVTLPVASPPM